jgi:hypothetical protein
MEKRPEFIYSFTGRKVGPGYDVPSLQDIAVGLGRICRYAGGCVRFWTVLQHSFVVADLLAGGMKKYGLLHDSTEVVIGDIPRGFKNEGNELVEGVMFGKILDSLSIPLLNEAGMAELKLADNRALYGEVWTVGNSSLREYYNQRDREAERLVLKYAREFTPDECIRPDGLAVLEFISRFRDYTGEGQ